MNPPAIPIAEKVRELARRAVARAAAVARVSAWTMLVLGGLSAAVSVASPVSASFAISVAVVINGWIELRLGRRLQACDAAAPRWLACNQVALGFEIAAYAAWQARAIGPDQIDAVLQRPLVARVLGSVPPELAHEVVAMLPAMVGWLYAIVGAGAFLGCVAAAVYYGTRLRWVRVCAQPEASSQPPPLA